MNIFVSWSGGLSHAVALALREWLPLVLPPVRLWVSSEDIPKGRQWYENLSKQMRDGDIGIFCLTAENVNSPWINFEAGAISKALPGSSLWTLLVGGLEPGAIRGPFEQIQHTVWHKTDVRRLVHSMNYELAAGGLPKAQVDSAFDEHWPKIEETVTQAIAANRQIVYLQDLAREEVGFFKRHFENVIIRGPGIIYADGCKFENCTWAAESVESMLWSLETDRRKAVDGAIGFLQCRFIKCRFERVGITGTPELLDKFRSP